MPYATFSYRVQGDPGRLAFGRRDQCTGSATTDWCSPHAIRCTRRRERIVAFARLEQVRADSPRGRLGTPESGGTDHADGAAAPSRAAPAGRRRSASGSAIPSSVLERALDLVARAARDRHLSGPKQRVPRGLGAGGAAARLGGRSSGARQAAERPRARGGAGGPASLGDGSGRRVGRAAAARRRARPRAPAPGRATRELGRNPPQDLGDLLNSPIIASVSSRRRLSWRAQSSASPRRSALH